MLYKEFINLRQQNKILAGINNHDALKLVELLPKRYQYLIYFWSFLWILSIPTFILLAIFFTSIYWFLLLFFVTPLLFQVTKRSASEFVLEYAEKNKEFFNYLMKKNLLVFYKYPIRLRWGHQL